MFNPKLLWRGRKGGARAPEAAAGAAGGLSGAAKPRRRPVAWPVWAFAALSAHAVAVLGAEALAGSGLGIGLEVGGRLPEWSRAALFWGMELCAFALLAKAWLASPAGRPEEPGPRRPGAPKAPSKGPADAGGGA